MFLCSVVSRYGGSLYHKLSVWLDFVGSNIRQTTDSQGEGTVTVSPSRVGGGRRGEFIALPTCCSYSGGSRLATVLYIMATFYVKD